jgi:DNA-binding IclR family transcriptional regulator
VNIAVLTKAFSILEALDRHGGPLALKELSKLTGISKPTTYRILQALATLDYVSQQGNTGWYQLTMQLAELGRRNQYDGLIGGATFVMEDLYAKFNETTNLGTIEGAHVCYLHVLETTQPLRWIVKPGNRDAFHSTALGRAIAAYLPKEEQEELLDAAQMQTGVLATSQGRSAIRTILAETRKRGWAIDNEENDIGVVCFAVPLLENGYPIASISISLPHSRLTPTLREGLVAALLEGKENWKRRNIPYPEVKLAADPTSP